MVNSSSEVTIGIIALRKMRRKILLMGRLLSVIRSIR